jgi:signal transduction histidine kinase/CheY-like chemotaxis protein
MAKLHPDDREFVRDYVAAILQQGETKTLCEYRMISSDREWLWYESMGKVVEYDVSGNPLTLFGIRSNVSDRKELTWQLQSQAEEIARATRAKSEFLATMSHEIRTPLNGILGMASLLEDADLSPSQREMVAVIRTSGAALLQILNDVLDFSRIEAGKLSIVSAPFSLQELIDHCLKSIEPVARRKFLTIGVRIAQNVPPQLLGDAIQLRTVMTHLLSNAVKFTDAGRIDLSISVCRTEIDGTWLRFEIRDTGCGIHAESQKKLFTPFTQVHGKGFTADSGSGLGLALSKRLVDALGGTISCSSQVGHGTCFTVELPFGVCAGSPIPQPGHEAQFLRENTRILVAEDNPFNQAVLRKMFERLGFTPAFVADGQAAVDAVQQENFDLVFMDCEMPILDGLEATRRIRELPGQEQLPIVALSAHPAEEYKSICEAAGMTDYLTKPISLDVLTTQLNRWASAVAPICTTTR